MQSRHTPPPSEAVHRAHQLPAVHDSNSYLHTVGVDIGTTTSHVVVGRLTVEAAAATSSLEDRVSNREVVYASPPALTPYREPRLIDEHAIRAFVAEQTQRLCPPAGFDAGALILTGFAAMAHNANAIAATLEGLLGDFVTVAAGDVLESILSVRGAGTIAYSAAHPDLDVLHVDIGGGTTKFVAVRGGAISAVGVLDIGARLVAWEGDRLTSVNRPSIERLGLPMDLNPGAPITAAERAGVAGTISDAILAVVKGRSAGVPRGLWRTEPIHVSNPDVILFSGGVAEYIYGRSIEDHGDLGLDIARKLRHLANGQTGLGGIRATVLGLAHHTTQISGSTIYLSRPDLLPIHNLTAVAIDASALADDLRISTPAAIRRAIGNTDLEGRRADVLITVTGSVPISYESVVALCTGILDSFDSAPTESSRLFISFTQDIAFTAGSILVEELGWPGEVVVLDGVLFQMLDSVDIGRPVEGGVVPVTIRRMVFAGD